MEEEQQFSDEQALVKRNQEERLQRKGQKKQNFLRALSRFFAVILLVGGTGYILTFRGWYLPADTFIKANPARVQIVNNKIVKTSKIKSVMKNAKVSKFPIFLTNMGSLRKELLSLPPVESVYVRRYAFPARVLIIVRESTPILTVSPAPDVSPVAAFTKDGKIISGRDYLPLPAEYKTLLVLSYGNKGDDYRKWDIKKIQEIEKIAKYVETFSREKVEYVDMRNPNDIYVKIKTISIRLGKYDDKIFERIKRIPSILPEAEKVKNKIDYIDIRWENVNYLKLKG